MNLTTRGVPLALLVACTYHKRAYTGDVHGHAKGVHRSRIGQAHTHVRHKAYFHHEVLVMDAVMVLLNDKVFVLGHALFAAHCIAPLICPLIAFKLNLLYWMCKSDGSKHGHIHHILCPHRLYNCTKFDVQTHSMITSLSGLLQPGWPKRCLVHFLSRLCKTLPVLRPATLCLAAPE